jgi:UDP-N-acetylmuramate--alanine ligase
MKPLNDIQAVYLVGIGGIGMSALARYFMVQGKPVAGYDKVSTPLTQELEAEGMAVHYEDSVELIPNNFKQLGPQHVLVIYTPAIPSDHTELNYLKTNGYTIMKRSQVLGELSRTYRTIAVAGTHGKTTTSSIVAHLLRSSSKDCNAFLGGISTNYSTNLLTSATSNLMVVEADEFDRSFLTLSPEVAIITSVDADHLDIYGTPENMLSGFLEFSEKVVPNGTLIYKLGLPFESSDRRKYTYSVSGNSDYSVAGLTISNGRYHFDLNTPFGKIEGISFGMPGSHNVENAVAAVASVQQVGLTDAEIKAGLSTYTGVKRRFEVHINTPETVYVDDYAHHPTELTACINSAREMWPGRTVKGIFQPHLFSRTKDHMEGFGQSLSLLDEVVLLDIYPAREKPMAGITSAALLEHVSQPNKKLLSKEDVLRGISRKNTDVLLTLGAGDIDQLVQPIKSTLS